MLYLRKKVFVNWVKSYFITWETRIILTCFFFQKMACQKRQNFKHYTVKSAFFTTSVIVVHSILANGHLSLKDVSQCTDHRGYQLWQVPQFGLSAEDDSTSVTKQIRKQKTSSEVPFKVQGMPKISEGRKSALNWSSWVHLLLPDLWQFPHGVGAHRLTTTCLSVCKIYFTYYFSVWGGCKMDLFTSAMWMQAILPVHIQTPAFKRTPDACTFVLPWGILFSPPFPCFLSLLCSITNKMLFWTGWKVMQEKVSFS